MLTYDGPGPSGSSTVAVRVLPVSVARMVIGPNETRDTHRILLALFGSGGACSASGVAQRMATMLPAVPITCGMGMSGGVNWAPAQRVSAGRGARSLPGRRPRVTAQRPAALVSPAAADRLPLTCRCEISF